MVSPPSPVPPKSPTVRTCSWCGKPEGEVRVVAGPGTNICEDCVRLTCAVLGIQILPEGQPAKPDG
jgi:hypothetical protein